MERENHSSPTRRAAKANLHVVALAALVACLLMLIWAFAPAFSNVGASERSTPVPRLLSLLGFIVLNVVSVLLMASGVAAMFAHAHWRRGSSRAGRISVFPMIAGSVLFAAQAWLMWQLAVAFQRTPRVDIVLWILAGIATSFLTTWLLLEPLLRLPREANDAARLDGLGFAGSFRHVLLPRMKTRLLLASILPLGTGLSYLLPSLAAL